jgi:hypothetical protein
VFGSEYFKQVEFCGGRDAGRAARRTFAAIDIKEALPLPSGSLVRRTTEKSLLHRRRINLVQEGEVATLALLRRIQASANSSANCCCMLDPSASVVDFVSGLEVFCRFSYRALLGCTYD